MTCLELRQLPIQIVIDGLFGTGCGLKYRGAVRLERQSERNILPLAGTDNALDIRLIHVSSATGHGFYRANFVV
jgi:hypothetical protein